MPISQAQTTASNASTTASTTLNDKSAESAERADDQNQWSRQAEVAGAGDIVEERSLWPTYAMGLGGMLSLGLAVTFEVESNGQADDAEELVRSLGQAKSQCQIFGAKHALCDAYESSRLRGIAFGRAAVGLAVVGTALFGGALGYWLWPTKAMQRGAGSKRAFLVVPTVGTAFFGSAMGGTF